MAQIPDDVAVALAAVTQDGPDMQSNTAKTVVQHHATVLNNEIKQEVSIVPEEKEETTDTHMDETGEKSEDPLDKALKDKEEQEEGYESSDLSSSSDDSDDSDEEDDNDDDNNDDEQDTNEPIQDIYDYDDEDEKVDPYAIPKTVNEITDIVIEKPNFEILPTTELVFIGNIYEILENVIVVQSIPESPLVLDSGTLFTYEDREIMGEVFETFGPVRRPFYSIRFNTADEIDRNRAKTGSRVFYVPEYKGSQPVPVEELKKMKYTDASNAFDEEIDEHEREFSDDEEELRYRRKKAQARQQQQQQQQQQQPQRAQRPPPPEDDFDIALAAYNAAKNVQTGGPSSGRRVVSYTEDFDDPFAATVPTATQPPQQSQQQEQQQQAYPSSFAAVENFLASLFK